MSDFIVQSRAKVGEYMSIIFLGISTVIMLVGLIGIFVPALPGVILVFVGTLLYAWATDFQVISAGYIIFFAALAAMAWAVDYIASLLTAKKYGTSKYGIIGSIILGILGLIFFSIPGLIIGQLLGVIIGELCFGKEMRNAVKSGLAVFVGYLLGNIVKIVLCSIIIVVFYYKVFT